MKLTKVKIQEFKSIIDSKEFSIENDYTVLAGKNESGKSNVLKAISLLLNTEHILPNLMPISIDSSKWNPKISGMFEFDSEEKLVLSKIFEIEENNLPKSVTVIKTKDNFNVELSVFNEIFNNKAMNKIQKFCFENNLNPCDDSDEFNLISRSTYVRDQINSVQEITEENKLTLVLKFNSLLEEDLNYDFIKNKIIDMLPKIIYHPNFKEVLPSKIKSSEDFNSRLMIKRLQSYLNCNFSELFTEQDKSVRSHLVENLSRNLDNDFQQVFTQNKTKLLFTIDGEELAIKVKDLSDNENNYESNSIEINERSEGFQWYLNFFITLKSEKVEKNSILLIDEPGVFLHPTAQLEMLKFIEKQSEEYQILFTSHSPYLINIDKQEKIRIVEKIENINGGKVNETKVVEKLHAATKSDSLKPIIDAIGYSVPDINLQYKTILICEGPSDYYYIKFLCKNKNIPIQNFNITFSGSADKMPILGKMYLGLGFNKIIYLLDTDTKGANIYQALINEGVAEEDIILLNEIEKQMIDGKLKFSAENLSIEDIFDKNFFSERFKEFSFINIEKFNAMSIETSNSKKVKEYEKSIKSDNNTTTIKWALSKEIYNYGLTKENEIVFYDGIDYLINKLKSINL